MAVWHNYTWLHLSPKNGQLYHIKRYHDITEYKRILQCQFLILLLVLLPNVRKAKRQVSTPQIHMASISCEE